MDSNSKDKSSVGFTDMLFNILVGFAFLFMISFLLIKPEAKKEDFERKAEFIIIMEWNHDAPDDIDLYVEDPLGMQVSFRNTVGNFMHLDKDDLGNRNDQTVVGGVTSSVALNREVVTIRGITKGEYIVNAHYYSKGISSTMIIPNNGQQNFLQKKKFTPKKSLMVRIEVHKVNPYRLIWEGEKKFFKKGQEETFVRFSIDQDGRFISPVTFEKKKFVSPLGSMGNFYGNSREEGGSP